MSCPDVSCNSGICKQCFTNQNNDETSYIDPPTSQNISELNYITPDESVSDDDGSTCVECTGISDDDSGVTQDEENMRLCAPIESDNFDDFVIITENIMDDHNDDILCEQMPSTNSGECAYIVDEISSKNSMLMGM